MNHIKLTPQNWDDLALAEKAAARIEAHYYSLSPAEQAAIVTEMHQDHQGPRPHAIKLEIEASLIISGILAPHVITEGTHHFRTHFLSDPLPESTSSQSITAKLIIDPQNWENPEEAYRAQAEVTTLFNSYPQEKQRIIVQEACNSINSTGTAVEEFEIGIAVIIARIRAGKPGVPNGHKLGFHFQK